MMHGQKNIKLGKMKGFN